MASSVLNPQGSSGSVATTLTNTGTPIGQEHKPIAWAVAGLAIVIVGCIISAIAGPIIALILTILIAVALIATVLFLTETPDSLKAIIDKIKENWNNITSHSNIWKTQMAVHAVNLITTKPTSSV